jgi:phenylalanyl-tRNA synthetase beta chain
VKVSYQWLSEYVDLDGYTAADLAERLTRIGGIEVDIVEQRNKGVENVVVGYVKSCAKHPDADKLTVCVVDAGQGEDLQIVCGAKNVAAGQKVPVALIGARLPGDVKIKKTKLRGVESQGMICSARELGLNDRLLPKEIQEGILVLPGDTPIGEDIVKVLGLDDEVLELDLTPNRADCLSMIGAAYEIAAIIGREVKLPDPLKGFSETETRAADRISVEISEPEHCYHYAARYIEGVEIGPSPLWLQNRLMAAGIRPINNVVDITNYVMLEYGQPLHAFDLDRLAAGRIVVRLARPGEKMVTLDDEERTLDENMLLITDGVKPIALAGVMGGANSEVTANTTRILLESACFAGYSVRRTSRALGLRSEASLRFEKEVNPEAVIPAINRAAELLAKYAGGKVAAGIVEQKTRGFEPVTISLSVDQVNRYLGTSIAFADMKDVFSRLQFPFQETGSGTLAITVPARRGDIRLAADLIEEVARLIGYDQIPTTLMEGATTPGALTREQTIRRLLRRLLTQSGFHEVINYSLTHPEKIASFPGMYADTRPIAVSMPMSEERSRLRTSLIPHLLDNAVYNVNRGNADLALFEMGSVFVTDEETLTRLPEEVHLLAVLWSGRRCPEHWNARNDTVDFYDLKGVAEMIFSCFGVSEVEYVPEPIAGMHPGRAASIWIKSGGEKIKMGLIGQLHPLLQQEKDLQDTYIMELSLPPLYRFASFEISYQPLPRYPSIVRDLAIVVAEDVQAGKMLDKIKEAGGSLLESVSLFDVYAGERIGQGKKSMAFSLVYRHAERTLTDEEVNDLHAQVVKAVEQAFGGELRK